MRLIDHRYAREREYYELGLRLLRHEARTWLIRTCTGLTEDRIRKLHKTYLEGSSTLPARRKRGKAPHEPTIFTRNARAHSEASLLAGILHSLSLAEPGNAQPQWQPSIPYVQRFCDAYEYFCDCAAGTQFSFEHAWFLMQTLAGNTLSLTECGGCGAPSLRDALASGPRACPFCGHKPALEPTRNVRGKFIGRAAKK